MPKLAGVSIQIEVYRKFQAYNDLLEEYFERVSSRFPGTMTLNEIRIAHAILIGTMNGDRTDNASVSEQLGISKATVSRAVQRLIELGEYTETIDPDDRRRRVLKFTPKGLQRAEDWVAWISSI